MNEGISMKQVGEVHVLDVYFNLGKVDQVVGRAIRWCSHYQTMSPDNVYPHVNVYKYVISMANSTALTSEEELYMKAEKKYMLIKKLERAMKERAFDCPLNIHGNIFSEEVAKHKKCGEHGEDQCPAICDYTKCDYKCDDPRLDYEYYDPERNIYKLIPKNSLDYSTFTHDLADAEIQYAKKKIKNMYIVRPVYELGDIVEYVKRTYDADKLSMFDEFFVYKALDQLVPVTDNDFNNFSDIIIDKNNTQGYLIYRDKYYIFQPFDQNEDVPLYYRTSTKDTATSISLYSYLKNIDGTATQENQQIDRDTNAIYNFDDTMEYYKARDEYKYVGIIDKELSRGKNKTAEEMKDVFKIRQKLPKATNKKRGTGIPSLNGSVCATSKTKEYLEKMAKDIGASIEPNMIRNDVCDCIERKMLDNEKYATTKDKNKITYVRIPANHPKYPFPYNLEDRAEHIVTKIRAKIKQNIDIKTIQKPITKGTNKGKHTYTIEIKNTSALDKYAEWLGTNHAVLTGDIWHIDIS
jgi:hypothetical protein